MLSQKFQENESPAPTAGIDKHILGCWRHDPLNTIYQTGGGGLNRVGVHIQEPAPSPLLDGALKILHLCICAYHRRGTLVSHT